jgi:hypothetical protein
VYRFIVDHFESAIIQQDRRNPKGLGSNLDP